MKTRWEGQNFSEVVAPQEEEEEEEYLYALQALMYAQSRTGHRKSCGQNLLANTKRI